MNRYILSKITRLSIWPLMAAAALCSCIKEDTGKGGKDKGEEKEVTISIAVPYAQVRSTRALDEADEDAINSIELLVYDASGNFDYISHGEDITDNGQSNLKSFQVVLRTGNPDITMLANCRGIIQSLYPSGIPVGTPRAAVESSIKLALSGKWIADKSAAGYRDIPMWGNIGQVTILPSTDDLGSGTAYQLYRMLASVDVTASLTDPSVFSLTSVRVYNVNREGAVVPADKTDLTTAPTIPSGVTPVKGPLLYDGTAISTDPSGQKGCVGEIYLFETPKGSKNGHPANPCIVVGGSYKGGKELFYRIDFQMNQQYLDILRNNRYQVVITSVDDQGFETPDEAYDAFPVGIEANVIDWSTGSGEEVIVGGSYKLKVSTDEMVFNPDGGTQVMYIYTDHPDGWKFVEDNFTPPPAYDWISFSVVKGNQGDYTEVRVTVEDYDGDPPRMYEIPVIVDNVEKTVRFAQLGLSDAALEIFATPAQIIFNKTVPTPVEIQVSTYPFNMPLFFEYSGDAFDWETGGYPADGTTDHTVKLHPKPNNTGSVRSGILTIYIQDSYGSIAGTRIELSQLDKVEGFDATLDPLYSAYPGTYTFNVVSTVAWQVNSVSSPADWIAGFTGQQTAAPGGQDYSFTLTGNPGFANRQIEVEILLPETGETVMLTFIQGYVSPFLYSYPDKLNTVTVQLPTEAGQTVDIKFETNGAWTPNSNMGSTTNGSTKATYLSTYTNPNIYSSTPFSPDIYTLQFRTEEYDWATSTQRGGRTMPTTRTINGQGYLAGTNIVFTLQRTVPHMLRLNPTVSSVDMPSQDMGTGKAYKYTDGTWAHVTNPSGEPPYFPDAPFYFTYNLDINTDFVAWSDLDPATTIPYTHGVSDAMKISGSRLFYLPIPENTTGSPRNFTVYLKKQDGDTISIPCVQYGNNPAFTVTVECENGNAIPIDTYLATHSNTFPTGGLVINVTPTGNQYGVFIYPRVNDKRQHSVTLVRGSGMYALSGQTKRMVVMPHTGEQAANSNVGIHYAPYFSTANATVQDDNWGYYYRSPIKSFQQNHRNYRLSTYPQRVVARTTLYNKASAASPYGFISMDWETAAGLDGYASTTLPQSQYYNYIPEPDFNNPGSCASYSEPDDGGKTWRLPTIDELREMYQKRFEIGGFYAYFNSTNVGYWAIDNTGSQASVINFNGGAESSPPKNSSISLHARCVRDY